MSGDVASKPEKFLEGIDHKKKDIKSACEQLLVLLRGIGGIDEELIKNVQKNVEECLNARTPSEQEVAAQKIVEATSNLEELNRDYNNLYSSDSSEYNLETSDKLKQSSDVGYCDGFRNKIKGVSNANSIINTFNYLITHGNLDIRDLATGREIVLDSVDYEIKILNLGNEDNKKKFGSYNRYTRKSNIGTGIAYYDTDEKGMEQISSRCSEGWNVATQKDIQHILNTLEKKYNMKSGKIGSIHDEDIAFFMLMTQTDGEILLKKDKLLGKNRVLKEYDDFRGFKNLRNGTGQIILIRKK